MYYSISIHDMISMKENRILKDWQDIILTSDAIKYIKLMKGIQPGILNKFQANFGIRKSKI